MKFSNISAGEKSLLNLFESKIQLPGSEKALDFNGNKGSSREAKPNETLQNCTAALTWRPALADLDCGALLENFPAPNLPPLAFPPFAGCIKNKLG